MIESADGLEGATDEFLEVPHLVYSRDPMWIPERRGPVAESFSARNPWFERGRARTFWIPGQARLAVFHDPAVRVEARTSAFFGFWETLGDLDSNARLFADAEKWARSQGAANLYGPMNFSVFGTYRLRVSAEAAAIPFPGEPYNPPYYVDLLDRLGYGARQHYTTWIADPADSQQQLEGLRGVSEELARAGYRIVSLDPSWWIEHLGAVRECLDAVLADYFAYAPLPHALFESTFGSSFIRRACPHSSVRAEAPDGSIAGFLIVYPHYGPLVVAGAGARRLVPEQLDYSTHLAALRDEAGPPDFIAYFVGVHPAHRNDGALFAAMSIAAVDEAAPRARRIFGAMSRASAPAQLAADGHDTPRRHYAIYSKRLEA